MAHPEATDALESEITKLGDVAIGVKADVGRIAELQALIDATVAKFGRVDIMVNNAGVETRTSVLDTTEDQYDKVLAINLKSAFFGTQMAARQMIAQGGGGRIINITSVHEDWPMPGNTACTPACCRRRRASRRASRSWWWAWPPPATWPRGAARPALWGPTATGDAGQGQRVRLPCGERPRARRGQARPCLHRWATVTDAARRSGLAAA